MMILFRSLIAFTADDFMPHEKLVDANVFLDFKKAGVVLPPVLCEVLKRECADHLTIKQASVDAIKNTEGKWHCYSGNDLVDVSALLVIANGVDVNSLGLDLEFPLEKVRGQVAVLNETGPTKVIAKTVNAGKYITPSIAGKHYIGATYHRGDSSLLALDADKVELLAAAEKTFPGEFSANSYSTAWVGIRSMSKDRVPVVGPVPDITFYKREYRDICHGNNNKVYQPAQYLDGLYVSAAHGSRGFSSCFLSAEIIAAQIRGEPLPVSKKVADYLSPSRFIVNDLKRS